MSLTVSEELLPKQPLVTDLYLRELIAADVPKPTALGTPARFSDAGGCSRAIGYSALGVEPTNPMDAPGKWVTNLGTLIHEEVQAAMLRRYPNAQVEVPSMVSGVISGSCDGLIPESDLQTVAPWWGGGHAIYELKTMGSFAYDKQIGLKRRARKIEEPEGPKFEAILQAGLNAIGTGASTLIMGSISMEAVSIQLAQSTGLDEISRVMSEFVLSRAYWQNPAALEAARITKVVFDVQADRLPAREVVTSLEGERLSISPSSNRPHWRCTYCKFQNRCIEDGGSDLVPVDIRRSANA